MARIHLTAVYDTRGAADTARSGLIDLGVSKSDTSISGTHEPLDTDEGLDEPTSALGSLWGGFSGFFIPEEDRGYYEEGVRRGGFVLNAQIDDSLEPQARKVLERSEPLNLDEEGQNWRRTGWPGSEPGRTVGAGGAKPREPWHVRAYREG